MKEIPTLFERVFENHKKGGIKADVVLGMEWVLAGEGGAVRQWRTVNAERSESVDRCVPERRIRG